MLDAEGRRDHRRRALRGAAGAEAYRAGHYERDLTVKAGKMSPSGTRS